MLFSGAGPAFEAPRGGSEKSTIKRRLSAECSKVERIAKTSSILCSEVAHFMRRFERGGDFPLSQKTEFAMKLSMITFAQSFSLFCSERHMYEAT